MSSKVEEIEMDPDEDYSSETEEEQEEEELEEDEQEEVKTSTPAPEIAEAIISKALERPRATRRPARPSIAEIDTSAGFAKPSNADDEKTRQKQIILLNRYLTNNKLGPYLRDKGFSDAKYSTMNVQALKDEIIKIQDAVAEKNSQGLVHFAVTTGVAVAEKISTDTPAVKEKFDLTGLSVAIKHNEQIQDLLAELELSMGLVELLSPEKRLVLAIAQSALFVAAANANNKKLNQ